MKRIQENRTTKREADRKRAIKTLINLGSTCYDVESFNNTPIGQRLSMAFGQAIANWFTPKQILILAAEALEDQNCHEESAILRKLSGYHA